MLEDQEEEEEEEEVQDYPTYSVFWYFTLNDPNHVNFLAGLVQEIEGKILSLVNSVTFLMEIPLIMIINI